MRLTRKQIDELWSESGPYSQAQLITEVRILDDKISRTFVIVSVNINPFTFKFISKNIRLFKSDSIIKGIINHAACEGKSYGYSAYLFQQEYVDEAVMLDAKTVLVEANKALIRMHRAVIESLKLQIKGTPQKHVFGIQRVMTETFIRRYLNESGKKELSGIEEANAVLQCEMAWWNEKLSTKERRKIESLPMKEQQKIFMEADIDFSHVIKRHSKCISNTAMDVLCSCGSGKPYLECCCSNLH